MDSLKDSPFHFPKNSRKLPVFFDPRQQVGNNHSFSPSAGKPARVLEDWQRHKLPLEILPVTPTTLEEMSLAHDSAYISGILSGKIANGFGNRLPEVAASLPWTTGSLASAARYAITHGVSTISLSSGFHHAGYDFGGGFCTLNGLMITAQLLKKEGLLAPHGRIGILDLDQHYGNGTDDILRRLKLAYIDHYTMGGGAWLYGRDGSAFLEKLPGIFQQYFSGIDLLLYQAGADSCLDDPLGGTFTQPEMRLRDREVFRLARERRIPVVWNLAGGYQNPFSNVLALHRATAEEHLRIFCGIEIDTGVEREYVTGSGDAWGWV